jgi:hypothetical protein
MFHLRLDALREKLLLGGIAPRHVRRYLGELRQHFDDLLRAEANNGLSGEAAFQTARARLGSDDDLAAAMLARPELCSIGARFPWAVFGIAPVVLLALLLLAAVFVEVGLMRLSHGEGLPAPDWMKSCAALWNWSMMYAFPVIVAAIFYGIGARQLMTMRWLVSGALLSAVLSAAFHCTTIFSGLPGKSTFSVSFGLNSDEALLRMAASIVPVCIMSGVYWVWQRRKSAITS